MIHPLLIRGAKYLQPVEQVEPDEVECHLKEERAALTRFDTQLRELDEVIKAKKEAASDAESAIKKLKHEVQAFTEEKASPVTAAMNLEKQHEWIAEGSSE